MRDERGEDDDALMLAYAAGDVRAFERLFQRHRAPLFTYLLHHTGRRGTADDLFQEVFLRLVRSRAEFRPSGSFRAWLYRIAHNALADRMRRAALRSSEGQDQPMDANTPESWAESIPSRAREHDPVASSGATDLREHIEAALRKLPEAQREVFLLRERAGLDLARIAEVTGANLATVKPHALRARGSETPAGPGPVLLAGVLP